MPSASRETDQLATRKKALNMSRPVLLGTYGSETALQALMRYPDGRIENLRVGSQTGLGQVAAVAPDAVHIVNGSRKTLLSLPKQP